MLSKGHKREKLYFTEALLDSGGGGGGGGEVGIS